MGFCDSCKKHNNCSEKWVSGCTSYIAIPCPRCDELEEVIKIYQRQGEEYRLGALELESKVKDALNVLNTDLSVIKYLSGMEDLVFVAIKILRGT